MKRRCGSKLPCVVGKPKQVAVGLGLSHYFTGKTCCNGHVCWRRTCDGKCVDCVCAKKRRQRRKRGCREYGSRRRTGPRLPPVVRVKPLTIRPAKIKVVQSQKTRKKRIKRKYKARDIIRIFFAQKGRCAYCRLSLGENYQVDHIVPISKGGANAPANLQLTCGSCNGAKRTKDAVDFAQSLGLLI
jgi:5-methylcytosine-specific restriction endonuclease McrA